jgi:hypothetical protein
MLPGFGGHLVSEFYLESQIVGPDLVPETVPMRELKRDLVKWRLRCESLGPASSVRTMFDAAAAPLAEILGFERPVDAESIGGILVATLRSGDRSVGLVVANWGDRLDPLWRQAVTSAQRRLARWSLLFNGTHLRIVDVDRVYARRFLEFDLDLAVDDERTFAAFWSTARAAVLTEPGRPSLNEIVSASEQHATAVCRSLREGVLAAAGNVLSALVRHVRLKPGATTLPTDSLEQSLTIVYRLLFLLFAESRNLVPLWHPVYRESYSIEALRVLAERPARTAGFWDALRAIARLAHTGCRAGDLRVTPFNGRLFAPARTPLAERRDLDDDAARRAVLALSTRPSQDRSGRERIAYRDLGVEQLGAVYETLLDYMPRISSAGVTLVAGSGLRKATGTFYTPLPIADYLIRRTLGPLVANAPSERILRLRIVDPAMGSGAFLVGACRYLAAAYEEALLREGGCHPSDFGEQERAAIRRVVAERCLYGVDVNPMAVQLARLSLWLATLAAARPLTFLDHHLLVGDSLLGASLSALRRTPGLRRERGAAASLPLFDDSSIRLALKDALPVRFKLESIAADTLDQVREKERALAALNRRDAALTKWKLIADLWCASWFRTATHAIPPTVFGALCDAILTGRGALPDPTVASYLDHVRQVAATRRFLHWELEFPEAFFEGDGAPLACPGFDAVIGNPPWDMIRADATTSHVEYRENVTAVLRFTRDSGLYTAQSAGHANRYQLFLERAIALTRAGGRIGLVLPSGFATDRGSTSLRRRLFAECDVDAIVGFDNQQAVFPIHRSVRFLLITAQAGSPTRSIACRLGERDPLSLELSDDRQASTSWFPVRVTPEVLRRISPDDLAIPNVRSPIDVTIVERAVMLFPALGSAGGWSARFGRELNATEDRQFFRSGAPGLSIVEGKQIDAFQVDLESARYRIAARDARKLLSDGRYERPRLGYRDVASATNRMTLIAALLPAGCVSTHTVFCLRTPLPLMAQHFLIGLFNTFVLNYLVRLRVTTHVTTAVVEALPVPRRCDAPDTFERLAAVSRLLARRQDDAQFVRLQAVVAGLYQLSVEEFSHILETFPLVPKEIREQSLANYRRSPRT